MKGLNYISIRFDQNFILLEKSKSFDKVLQSFSGTAIKTGDSLLMLPDTCDAFLKFRLVLNSLKTNNEYESVFNFQSKSYFYHIASFTSSNKVEYELTQIEVPELQTILPICNGTSYNKCAVLDCSSDLIWITNKNQQLVNYNKSFKNYYTQILNREPYRGILLSASEYHQLFSISINFTEVISAKSIRATAEVKGAKQIFEINFHPIHSDDTEQVTHISACARNISEKNNIQVELSDVKTKLEISKSRMEKELKLKELKSHFVSMASHEFRTPLAVMQSTAELLEIQLSRSTHPDKADLNENVMNLKSEISRMNLLIDDILVISKIENDKIAVKKEPVNIIDVIKAVIERNNSLQQDGRTVILNTSQENINLAIDKNLITYVFDNLISNAFKYSQNKPAPIIDINLQKNSLLITIKDFGIGIPDNQKQNIFQTFFRASNARRIKGTGLGLFIVRSFIELHDGTVSFNSIENEGSQFIITFPLD